TISKLYKSQNQAELQVMIKKITRLVTLITTPIVLFLVFFGRPILEFFGENFVEGRSTLNIIAIGFLINVMTGNVDQILNMTDNQKVLRNITIFGFILNVLLNLALIPRFGINGAAVASLITNVVFNLTCVVYIKKRLGFYTFI
ncbi:MAG TPA: polysaccharide biosynthesis C-terminal domain-containing protein, partial [Flavitalea sp.]|nr:polysaccharide biosynthesis C-terminal domain-containing protein [Flavitalea sp.]